MLSRETLRICHDLIQYSTFDEITTAARLGLIGDGAKCVFWSHRQIRIYGPAGSEKDDDLIAEVTKSSQGMLFRGTPAEHDGWTMHFSSVEELLASHGGTI